MEVILLLRGQRLGRVGEGLGSILRLRVLEILVLLEDHLLLLLLILLLVLLLLLKLLLEVRLSVVDDV